MDLSLRWLDINDAPLRKKGGEEKERRGGGGWGLVKFEAEQIEAAWEEDLCL